MLIKTVKSINAWWKETCIGISLTKITLIVLTLPSTTAATKWSFRTYFGLIHTAQRNLLFTVRPGKLAFMTHNIKIFKPESQTSMAEFQRSISNKEVQCHVESKGMEMKEDTDEHESSFSEHEDDF